MEKLVIDTGNSGLWFSLVFIFTVILVDGVFIAKGIKQGRSFTTMWLITVSGMLFFILGIHLFPLSFEQLKEVLIFGKQSGKGEQSVMGGVLVLAGLLLAILWLKEKVSLIDNLAVPFIVGIGLQNIGCLMAGCCYGNPCLIPWGIRYDERSHAFAGELQKGLVHYGDTFSQPVHPVQIYVLAGCLLIAFIIWKTRHKWRAPLSSFIFGWGMYCGLRFITEFFRDPASNHGLGYEMAGMKALQWLLLAMVSLSGIILFAREYYRKIQLKIVVPIEAGNTRIISLCLFLLLISWWMRDLAGITGRIIIFSSLVIAMVLAGWKLFKMITLPEFRLATILVFLLTCVFMGQSYIPEKENEKIVYSEVSGGLQFSHFFNDVYTITQSNDCNGNPDYIYVQKWLEYNSYQGGLSYWKTQNLDKYKRQKYGVNSYFGLNREIDDTLNKTKSLPVFALQPSYAYGTKWFGFSLGLNLGVFYYTDFVTNYDPVAEHVGKVDHDLRKVYIMPSGSIRVGPYDTFYFDFSFTDFFPSASPTMFVASSLGTGLGKTDGRFIKLGVSTGGTFVQLSMPVKGNTFIDMSIAGKGLFYDAYETDKTTSLSLGLHHRFNYKTLPRTHRNAETNVDSTYRE